LKNFAKITRYNTFAAQSAERVDGNGLATKNTKSAEILTAGLVPREV